MSLYIIGGVFGVIGVLYAMFKYEQFKADKANERAKKLEEGKAMSDAVIMQQAKISESRQALELELHTRRKYDQAKIDSGDRSGLDNDEY
jgi:hypothetical protein